ncbi:TRAP transporter small permease subunit [Tropicibacter alexandrii]|uniref:TRAP transporter small permease subunit n=1 Tax=Tropicibacter alexandrii TaxID=2267683 RepID=UPI0013E8B903|nr:TRAP transporter small permease [Tropicibacter alexandrii]
MIDSLSNNVAGLSKWLLVPMFGISFYEVVSRYVFGAPTTWAAAFVSILFIAAVVPAGADLAARQGHIRMDAFYVRWGPAARRRSDILTALVLLALAALLTWKAGEMAEKSVSIMERSWGVFRAPIYPKKLAFAIGAGLMLLQSVALLIRALKRTDGGRDGF